MADDLENLARRLQEFVETAGRAASARNGMQAQVGVPPPTPVDFYKKCLGALASDDRAALDRII
jgi:hypothetical protein